MLTPIEDPKLVESLKTKFSEEKWKVPFFLQFDRILLINIEFTLLY